MGYFRVTSTIDITRSARYSIYASTQAYIAVGLSVPV